MAAPTISSLPTVPSRSQAPEAFVSAMDAFLGAFPGLRTQINAAVAYIEALAVLADGGTYQVQTSAQDFTPGRLLRLSTSGGGAFGLGSLAPPTLANLDSATDQRRGFYKTVSGETAGTFPAAVEQNGGLLVFGYDANDLTQLYQPNDGSGLYYRGMDAGVLGAWKRLDAVYGTGANGSFLRVAGVQLCWHRLAVPISSSTLGSATWTFPAAFSAAPKNGWCNAAADAYRVRASGATTAQATISAVRRDASVVSASIDTDVFTIGTY